MHQLSTVAMAVSGGLVRLSGLHRRADMLHGTRVMVGVSPQGHIYGRVASMTE